ncbi:MAG: protein-L-isoaspartate(D-aspartate) O-methyltransferase [Rhodospirillales bacterium]|nr:protein-L-isoaspartate(D-aspartate) O-methyltransferase [Rhodospirillales bacterium]MCB9995295.1 protein-L-isoaspartate(D-aspartate) O-methyltransferase [Rhodospirillales bacterium]
MNSADTRKIRLVMHLRSMGISDTNVLAAMEKVPRDAFIPAQMQDQAYEDIAVPIGRGQTISQPFVVATMTQALEVSDRDKVLEIGTGSGYQCCVLAHLCRRVYSIERHKPLLLQAEKMFDFLKLRNITAIAGDGMKGWPGQAPFDKIICTACAPGDPPAALLDQLKIGGIMVIPVATGEQQVLRRYKKEGEDTFAVKDLMPVRFVPLLPNLAPASENADDEYGFAAG